MNRTLRRSRTASWVSALLLLSGCGVSHYFDEVPSPVGLEQLEYPRLVDTPAAPEDRLLAGSSAKVVRDLSSQADRARARTLLNGAASSLAPDLTARLPDGRKPRSGGAALDRASLLSRAQTLDVLRTRSADGPDAEAIADYQSRVAAGLSNTRALPKGALLRARAEGLAKRDFDTGGTVDQAALLSRSAEGEALSARQIPAINTALLSRRSTVKSEPFELDRAGLQARSVQNAALASTEGLAVDREGIAAHQSALSVRSGGVPMDRAGLFARSALGRDRLSNSNTPIDASALTERAGVQPANISAINQSVLTAIAGNAPKAPPAVDAERLQSKRIGINSAPNQMLISDRVETRAAQIAAKAAAPSLIMGVAEQRAESAMLPYAPAPLNNPKLSAATMRNEAQLRSYPLDYSRLDQARQSGAQVAAFAGYVPAKDQSRLFAAQNRAAAIGTNPAEPILMEPVLLDRMLPEQNSISGVTIIGQMYTPFPRPKPEGVLLLRARKKLTQQGQPILEKGFSNRAAAALAAAKERLTDE